MAVIYAFLKIFESEKYANDFVSGRLYMNNIRYFKEYRDESGELRGDEYEGIIAIYQPSKIDELKIGNLVIPKEDLAAPIVVHGNELLDHNVFCIYSLNSRGYESISAETIVDFKRTIELHESCFGLGKHCVVILNATEFISRCQKAVERLNVNGKLGCVDYFDEHKFHGELPKEMLGYQKRSLFRHQREYRIKIDINIGSPSPYTLDVGDLSDIAIITTPSEFNNQLQLSLPDGSYA